MATEEYLDVLTEDGRLSGISAPRRRVHAEGLCHRAVHVWLYAEASGQLLLQKRAAQKDSWAGLWDISSAGHISAGDTSLATARRELEEELGVKLPEIAFEFLFEYLQHENTNGGAFVNNEYNDVYLVTLLEPIPLDAFTLQASEVEAVKWLPFEAYEAALVRGDPSFVPLNIYGAYGRLFDTFRERYFSDPNKRTELLTSQLQRYVPVTLSADLSKLSDGDREALRWTVKAAESLEEIFLVQESPSNPALRLELEARGGAAKASPLDRAKLHYYRVNKSPWSVLDENEPYLSTADSKLVLAPTAVKEVPGFARVRFRAAFPQVKPKGANFYPLDMDRIEFELWESKLTPEEREAAKGFFTVIRRPTDQDKSEPLRSVNAENGSVVVKGDRDLQILPYSTEYGTLLEEAKKCLKKAAEFAETPSLKKFLSARADAFLSNDYYESDVAWMDLDSPVDITIGPYETYEDALFGYKATFEAFIGLRDDDATAKVKLFGDHLQELEDHLPEADEYKQRVEGSSPIRVIQLVFSAGDVKGPQTVAFNLPNDERITRDRGTAMVMLRNVSEAKFEKILLPIAATLIRGDQKDEVSFDAFYTHTLCHECCHGIGPHTITLPGGGKSTARQELQELYSSLEEAKADIVGLWALHYLMDKGLLPASFEKAMYVAFLAGCFRSVRFGLAEAHGKGQALQFNWIYEAGGFVLKDGYFAVDFTKVRAAVKSLSTKILTIQAQGDKAGAAELLQKFGTLTEPLDYALKKLERVNVPIDIAPSYTLGAELRKII